MLTTPTGEHYHCVAEKINLYWTSWKTSHTGTSFMNNDNTTESDIKTKVDANLGPDLLLIENESHKHGGHATDSHFKLTVVAAEFEGMKAVKRHQRVYGILADELKGGVHALALHLFSPKEWEQSPDGAPRSPNCLGGSKG